MSYFCYSKFKMIDFGKWTQDSLEHMLRKASTYTAAAERIDYISSFFLGVAYEESTLKGDLHTTEALVINLRAVDCFTFIDYVEAMRLSGSFEEFEKNLKSVRYLSGIVGFTSRKHFFTDWAEFNNDFIEDVTAALGGQKTMSDRKQLNNREDGTVFLRGIEPCERKVAYIPSVALDDRIVYKLQTGDYIGIYSASPGLDVSHVGIFIRSGENMYLRHASSEKKHRKVVDHDFKNYVAAKPGIIVLRPI